MHTNFFVMVTIAFLLALCSAWMANRWIESTTVVKTNVTPIVVAATEIPYGVKLDESMIKLISWPESTLPQGAYTSKEQVINRITMNKFYADEIITEKRISEHFAGSTLSALIAKEYRALTVRVDDVVGVAGFILPGNRVDILTTKLDRTANLADTHTLLENIKVLAVDQEVSTDKEKPAIVRAVTLELKPEQAEIIVKSMQEGSIQLTLRNPLDSSLADIPAKPAEPQPKMIKQNHVSRHVQRFIAW